MQKQCENWNACLWQGKSRVSGHYFLSLLSDHCCSSCPGCVTDAQGGQGRAGHGSASSLRGARDSLDLGRFREILTEVWLQESERNLEMRFCGEKRGKAAEEGWCSARGRLENGTGWGVLSPGGGGLCWKPCSIPTWAFLEAVECSQSSRVLGDNIPCHIVLIYSAKVKTAVDSWSQGLAQAPFLVYWKHFAVFVFSAV